MWFHKEYFYIIGEDEKGEPVFAGPYDTEAKANEEGFAMFPNMAFVVEKYPTRDRASATAMWKKKRAVSGIGLNMALKPVKHMIKK